MLYLQFVCWFRLSGLSPGLVINSNTFLWICFSQSQAAIQQVKCYKNKNVTRQKTQNVINHKISNCEKSRKLKLRLHSKTQTVAKSKDLNCKKKNSKTLVWIKLTTQYLKKKNQVLKKKNNLWLNLLVRTTWHIDNGWDETFAILQYFLYMCHSGSWRRWRFQLTLVLIHKQLWTE